MSLTAIFASFNLWATSLLLQLRFKCSLGGLSHLVSQNKTECTSHVCQDLFIHTCNDKIIHCNVYYKSDYIYQKWLEGLNTITSEFQQSRVSIPSGSWPGVHQPSIDTVFSKCHLLVRTATWGSKGDKEKGEHIKMYSASVGKYDMRANTRKG